MTDLTMLFQQSPVKMPDPVEVMTSLIELPPGDPGNKPHRHTGPVFAYMLEGEMTFELEGEAPRTIRAGEAFWEPGGDVIHYQAANNLPDQWSRFIAVMMGEPGAPMLIFCTPEELEERKHLRVQA